MRAANRVRTPERAAAAESDRTAALVRELVEQLGRMRGAAMKVGQMISMVEFDGLAEEQQDELQRQLAALRDDIPPVPFARLEKLLRKEFGAPLGKVFSDFEERAFAAASIGQVHRATTLDGDDVVVKVQYPGVAEAVETDLRNALLLVPLVKRLAPGLDAKALAIEMRERIGEELDYELEAQNQRRIERLTRGHPFICVPHVYTDLSTRRVLVSEYIEGERFEDVRRAGEDERDRYGEIIFRFFFGLLYRDGIALGDPHPGNYLLRPDGQVCFLDFGLLRDIDGGRLAAEAAIACAVRESRPADLKAALIAGGYLPTDRADAVDADFALRLMRHAVKWYAVPGWRRFSSADNDHRGRDRERGDGGRVDGEPVDGERADGGRVDGERADGGRVDGERADGGRGDGGRVDGERRASAKTQVNQFTLPPETVLIRRMHGIVAIVLHNLRAGANWGAIAAEYLHDAPPATPLGQAESDFLAGRGRGRRAGARA
jgi:predicted unusual protein kinase regulating ubiquinone biosynthesis (AarF/ABC1/UbiB family)